MVITLCALAIGDAATLFCVGWECMYTCLCVVKGEAGRINRDQIMKGLLY